jgi:isocitrate dehydrogenase
MATIFAWTGALRKRGQLDAIPALVSFADKLEAACMQTLSDGIMTRDLVALAEGPVRPTEATSEEFLKAIRVRLEKTL